MPTGNLPASGKALWEKVYDQALKGSCKEDKECAARTAWSAVKGAGWSKDKDGNWHKKSDCPTFSLAITKASYDKVTNEMRWQATASDTQDDLYDDNMSLELFSDFIERIEAVEPAPEDFRSAFWVGGMPYLSISHYPDLDGRAVPGAIEAVYVDGDQLKSKGTFNDTPHGRACFKAVCDDLYGKNKDGQDKVRISIAFLDYKHRHKDTNFIFERKSLDDNCPECFKNMITGVLDGKPPHPTLQGPKEYLRGQLIHEAMTRVPVNTRTLMEVERAMTTRKEDAASIVGEELAEEIEKEAALVGKSEALVIKADAMLDCAENESEEDCRKRMAEVEATNTETKVLSEHEYECADDDEDCKDKKKMPKKSKVVEVDFSPILSELAQLRSLVTPPKVEPHPLDGVFAELKSQFDVQVASGAGEEDVLRALQEPYSAIGEIIKASVHPHTDQPVERTDDTLNTVLQSLQQLSQQVGLLSNRLDGMARPPTEVMVPQRRQVSPQSVPQVTLQRSQVERVQSSTPKLRALIDRTTN